MGKQSRELYASRIWRTVVFAGAMLGGPATAGADRADPPPPQPAQPNAGAPAAVAPARPMPVDPIVQKKRELAIANTERSDLIAKLGEADVKELDKIKKDIAAKDAQVKKLVDALVALRKPRPRVQETQRPVGRGFVLA